VAASAAGVPSGCGSISPAAASADQALGRPAAHARLHGPPPRQRECRRPFARAALRGHAARASLSGVGGWVAGASAPAFCWLFFLSSFLVVVFFPYRFASSSSCVAAIHVAIAATVNHSALIVHIHSPTETNTTIDFRTISFSSSSFFPLYSPPSLARQSFSLAPFSSSSSLRPFFFFVFSSSFFLRSFFCVFFTHPLFPHSFSSAPFCRTFSFYFAFHRPFFKKSSFFAHLSPFPIYRHPPKI